MFIRVQKYKISLITAKLTLIIAVFCLFCAICKAQIIQHGSQYQKSLGDSSETIAAGGNAYNNMTGFIFPNAGLLGTFLVYNDTILPKRYSLTIYDSALHQWFPRVLTGGITVNDTGFVTVTGSGITQIYSHGVPVQIFGTDSIAVNLVAGSGISITAGATADTIKTTGAPPTGAAGGDLVGSYPAPDVNGLRMGDTVLVATTALPSGTTAAKYGASFIHNNGTLAANDTLTLPTFSLQSLMRKYYLFIKEDSTTHFIHIQPHAGDSILGLTTGVSLQQQHDFVLLFPSTKFDGAPVEWTVISERVNGLSVPAPPGGAAGGDLTGTYPNPTIANLQGYRLDITPPANGNLLIYSTGSPNHWVNNPLSGDASLLGSGLITVTGLQGNSVTSGTLTTGQALIAAGASTWSPSSYNCASYSPGAQVSQAQNTNEKVSFTNTHFYGAWPGAAGDGQETLAPVAGHITYFAITTSVAPAVGQHFVFTININGVATAAQIILANPNTSGNTGAISIAYSQDDRLSIEVSTSTTAGALGSWDGGISCVFP